MNKMLLSFGYDKPIRAEGFKSWKELKHGYNKKGITSEDVLESYQFGIITTKKIGGSSVPEEYFNTREAQLKAIIPSGIRVIEEDFKTSMHSLEEKVRNAQRDVKVNRRMEKKARDFYYRASHSIKGIFGGWNKNNGVIDSKLIPTGNNPNNVRRKLTKHEGETPEQFRVRQLLEDLRYFNDENRPLQSNLRYLLGYAESIKGNPIGRFLFNKELKDLSKGFESIQEEEEIK